MVTPIQNQVQSCMTSRIWKIYK